MHAKRLWIQSCRTHCAVWHSAAAAAAASRQPLELPPEAPSLPAAKHGFARWCLKAARRQLLLRSINNTWCCRPAAAHSQNRADPLAVLAALRRLVWGPAAPR